MDARFLFLQTHFYQFYVLYSFLFVHHFQIEKMEEDMTDADTFASKENVDNPNKKVSIDMIIIIIIIIIIIA